MSLRQLHRSSPGPLVRAAAALLVSTSLAACELPGKNEKKESSDAESKTAAPSAQTKSAIGAGTEDVGRSAADIEKWIRAHVEADTRSAATRTQLEVVAEGRHWRLIHPDRLLSPGQPVTVEIVRHPAMTVMMVPLLRVPKNPPSEILGALLAQNYELYQAKLSLGPQGDLYVSYEVPNRLLDEQELIENVEDLSLLSQNLTGLVEQRLVEIALGMSPDGAQRAPQGPPQGQPPIQQPGMQGAPQGFPPQAVHPPDDGLSQHGLPPLPPPGDTPVAPPLPPHLNTPIGPSGPSGPVAGSREP